MRRVILGSLGALVALTAILTTAYATNGNPINTGSQAKYTLAVVGDMPYGAAKIAAFPGFIDFMNGDPKVDLVAHLGDIKSGSTLCTDEYFEDVREQLDRLRDPIVYTPGDNEWTDCHRASNGNYKPTERLDQLRSEFFPVSGETIGGRGKHVLTQADDPVHSDYVENVMWMESIVVFATLNVPGPEPTSRPIPRMRPVRNPLSTKSMKRSTSSSARSGATPSKVTAWMMPIGEPPFRSGASLVL